MATIFEQLDYPIIDEIGNAGFGELGSKGGMADGIESPCEVERYDRNAVISRKEFGGMMLYGNNGSRSRSFRPKGEFIFKLFFERGGGEGGVDVFENNKALNQS